MPKTRRDMWRGLGRRRATTRRRLKRTSVHEQLEARRVLASAWHNTFNMFDINADGFMAANDVLEIVAEINNNGSGKLPTERPDGEPFLDTNNDKFVSAPDAIDVVAQINFGNQGQTIAFSEQGTFVKEEVRSITLGQTQGTRTLRFQVGMQLDTTDQTPATEDRLNLYLVDPGDPSQTLLDRGENGTALLSISGDDYEFAPGIVKFDGTFAEIDLTSLGNLTEGLLVVQLINADADTDTRIVLQSFSNTIEAGGSANGAGPSSAALTLPGGAVDTSGFASTTDIQTLISNIRFDSSIGRYTADLQLQNDGANVGQQVAVAFKNLPVGVQLMNRSGDTAAGDPFINFAPAIAAGGLQSGMRTDRIRIVFDDPSLVNFSLFPEVLVGAANQAPVFSPIGPLSVAVGDRIEAELIATDADGDPVSFSIRSDSPLPTGMLSGNPHLVFAPMPGEEGSYQFDVVASDGASETAQTVNLEVQADAITTTRLSGVVKDTTGIALVGVRVEVGGVQTFTDGNGAFLLDFGNGSLPSDTLNIHADELLGSPFYPFLAERIDLVLGHEVFPSVNNIIGRTIFLPALDTANATTINPNVNMTVTTPAIPGLALSVAANTLKDEQGNDFAGDVTITEVPRDLTPAALPPGLNPDLVITVQPAGLVFSTPAPITFPNTAGWAPGVIMDIWSINHLTGEFDDVGDAQVSADGSVVETISGGVINSSWSFTGSQPNPSDPLGNPNNQDDGCDECPRTGSGNSRFEFQTGFLLETHELPTYQSQGATRGITLAYDSGRADPRPIVHTAIEDVDPVALAGSQADLLRLVASLSVHRGSFDLQVPGFVGDNFGFSGGENFWSLPPGVGDVDGALLVDLTNQPSGRYDYAMSSGIMLFSQARGFFTGSLGRTAGTILNVNSIDSPLGAGWGIEGLERIVENPDGSVLLFDGAGESLYEPGVRQIQDLLIQDTVNNSVARYDGVTGNRLDDFVTSGLGGLSQPHNPTFGPDGNLYVVSNGTNQVLRYDGTTGAFIDVFVDNGEGGYTQASELLFDPAGNLLAAIPGGNLGVLRYDPAGNFIDAIATPADGVAAACGIEFGGDGNLYVLDTGPTEQISRFDANGNFIDVFAGPGNIANACDFDFGPDGHIYVSNIDAGNVTRFNGATGDFIDVFAQTGGQPSGVTFGPDGNMYVNVSGNTNRFDGQSGDFINVFVPGNGGFVNFFPPPAPGSNNGPFISPPGDFSILEKLPDGSFMRTTTNQTVFRYDTNGLLVSQTDRNQNATIFQYDANDNIVRIIDPVGLETVFNYTGDKVTSITDPASRTTMLEYDANDNLVRITDPDGTSREFDYDARHHMVQEIDKRGNSERTTYDFAGRVDLMFRKDGSVVDLDPMQVRGLYEPGATVDPFNAQPALGDLSGEARVRDGNGNEIVSVLDNRGQEVSGSDAVGTQGTLQRNPDTNLVETITDARGNVSSFTYNDRGSVTSVTDANTQGNPLLLTYDPVFSRITSVSDELGKQTLFNIDPSTGDLLSMTEVVAAPGGADDVVTQFTYHPDGLLDRITNPLGRVTRFQYDPLGRPMIITSAVGTVDETTMQFEYDAAGNTTSIINGNGHRTELKYDALNRLMRITEPDPDGPGPLVSPVTIFTYDANGNLATSTDPRSNTRTFEYDALDRPIRTMDAETNETLFTYDNAGNLASATDPAGDRTRLAYDARDRLIEEVDPDGGRTRYEYDLDNNLTKLIDPLENETVFDYDARSNLVRKIDPLGKVETATYDAANNVLTRTDRNGRVKQFAYDDLNRLTTETWVGDGNVITFGYDANSNVVSIVDDFSELVFTYDALDRVKTVDNDGTPDAPNVVLTYEYDANGNVTQVTDTIDGNAGGQNTYAYDGLDRLLTLTQSGTGLSDKRVDFAYNPLGQFDTITRFTDLTGTQTVVATEYQYDTLNRLTDLTHRDGGAQTVAFYDLVYDADSRITQLTDIDGVTDYDYDDRDQLISAEHNDAANPDETYGYDAGGNRTESHLHGGAYDTQANNRLVNDGTFTYQYDDQGNLVLRTETSTGNTRTFEWDFRNRLRTIIDRDAASSVLQTVGFTYDRLDRRISKSVQTATDDVLTHFVYDREDVLLDFVDDDGVAGPNQPVLAQRYLHGPAVDQVLAQDDGAGNVAWLLADHLGSIRDLVDNAGTVLNHIKYDSYGNVISQSDPSVSTRYLYTGREFDVETGLYYYRSRFYDASIGRFISEDSIGFAGGDANLYRYVFNQPVTETDSSGRGIDRVVATPFDDRISSLTNSIESLLNRQNFLLNEITRLENLIYDLQDDLDELKKRRKKCSKNTRKDLDEAIRQKKEALRKAESQFRDALRENHANARRLDALYNDLGDLRVLRQQFLRDQQRSSQTGGQGETSSSGQGAGAQGALPGSAGSTASGSGIV